MTRALLIAIVVLAAGGAVLAGAGTEDQTPRYKVVLDNAFGLTEGADLKSAGVRVGSVDSLDVARQTARAVVTVKVERPEFEGFRTDVFCEVQPQSLIGEYFLNCQPGTKGRKLQDGATIPVEQTAGTIPADLVANIMRRPARERFALILAELGIGFAARGEDVQKILTRAVPALRETDRVLKILADNRRTLQALARESDTVLSALANNKQDVTRFVREARDTAAASADRHDDLQETVRKLPAFLRGLRPTLRALGTAAELQTPALRDLRASAPDLTELFERLGPFAEASRPAIRSLGDASVVGRRAVREADDTVETLRGLAAKSKEPLTNLRFVLEHLDDRDFAVEPNKLAPVPQKGFTGLEALLDYIFVQSQATNIFDKRGYFLKVNILSNECNQYTDAKSAKEEPERFERCKSFLGPNLPGITTHVDQGASARNPDGGDTPAEGRQSERRDAPAAAGRGGDAPTPSAPDRQQRTPRTVTGLVDKLLPGIEAPNVPGLPRIDPGKALSGTREDRSPRPSPSTDGALLDYLLGP